MRRTPTKSRVSHPLPCSTEEKQLPEEGSRAVSRGIVSVSVTRHSHSGVTCHRDTPKW